MKPLLHLFEEVRIRPANRQRFRQILKLNEESTAKGTMNAGNAIEINDGAAMDTPELIRIQLVG